MNRHRFVIGATLAALPLMLLGCPKKENPVVVVDSGPPPAVIDAALTELKPLDEVDAGEDAAPDAAKKPTGPGLTTSQLRAKQCCNALRNQAKAMGTSPESAQLLQLATMCDGIAMGLGPSKGPQAPELEPIRQILKGKPTLPPLCSGL